MEEAKTYGQTQARWCLTLREDCCADRAGRRAMHEAGGSAVVLAALRRFLGRGLSAADRAGSQPPAMLRGTVVAAAAGSEQGQQGETQPPAGGRGPEGAEAGKVNRCMAAEGQAG